MEATNLRGAGAVGGEALLITSNNYRETWDGRGCAGEEGQ
jgi:hypothetical protein